MCIPHYIPLRNQAIDVLKELENIIYDIAEGRSDFFCHAYKNPMSENTINKAFRQRGYDTQKDICGHIYSRSESSNGRAWGPADIFDVAGFPDDTR